MSLRNDLARVMARDSRYPISAYIFIFEAIDYTKKRHHRSAMASKTRSDKPVTPAHVTAAQLCDGAADLALQQYGLMARTVLRQWGIRSTSDLGEIVYNLIRSGDLEQSPSDSRSDFDNLFNLEDVLVRRFELALEDVDAA